MNGIEEGMDIIIEVFKTNVDNHEDAQQIIDALSKLLNSIRVTIDLEDCDRVLRVEGKAFAVEEVTTVLHLHGFDCELLI